jgi:hypothetical protein
VKKNFLQGLHTEIFYPECSECNVIVLDIPDIFDDVLVHHGSCDPDHIGDSFPVSAHQAVENDIE